MAHQQGHIPVTGVSRRDFLRRAMDSSPLERAGAGVTVAASCLANAGVACRLCEDTCISNAIRFRPQIGGHLGPEINATACNSCGQCVDVCPVGALSKTEGPHHA